MKKIGTITFHFATNYGAVLQAFALCEHLKKSGYDAEIIDYVPTLTTVVSKLEKLKARDFAFFKKEKNIKRFRKNELPLSRRYRSARALMKAKMNYDTVICGSDQIWNHSFTVHPRFGTNLSYFLPFAGDARRISYAASFGSNSLPENMKEVIKPCLSKFSKLSVRENTGLEILADLGFNAELVADPTLLLCAADYSRLLENKKLPAPQKVFSYILHKNQKTAKEISALACEQFGQGAPMNEGTMGIYEWLASIRDSGFVVTNSFHGTVFSLLFHTPFITVPVEGSGMNDRIKTLLGAVGLEDRIADSAEKANEILSQPINWDEVDKKIEALRELSKEFLSDI